jgi:hypothetical protein
VTLEAVVEKRRLDQALNAKEFTVLAGTPTPRLWSGFGRQGFRSFGVLFFGRISLNGGEVRPAWARGGWSKRGLSDQKVAVSAAYASRTCLSERREFFSRIGRRLAAATIVDQVLLDDGWQCLGRGR